MATITRSTQTIRDGASAKLLECRPSHPGWWRQQHDARRPVPPAVGCRARRRVRVWDADGNEYIDLNMAYGPLIFGHRPACVIEAVIRQISERGSQLGFPTEVSVRVAEKIRRLFPSMEVMRFANSGTEAMCLAARLARTVTGRKKIVVFEGNYHGWSDPLFHRYHVPVDRLPATGYGPAVPGTLGMNGTPLDLLVVRSGETDALDALPERTWRVDRGGDPGADHV